MKTSIKGSSSYIIWFSLVLNLLICLIFLPRILQTGSSFNITQVIETLFWQALGLITWPITLFMALINTLLTGALPEIDQTLIVFLYPLIEINLFLLLILKKNNWIPLVLTHIFLIISFVTTWIAVIRGYDFMVG